MLRKTMLAACLIATLPAWSPARADPARDAPSAGRAAPDSSETAPALGATVPRDEVIHPDPGATVDNAIPPPNVDPKMQIPAPEAAVEHKADPR